MRTYEDGRVVHIAAEERAGVSAPPPEFSELTRAEADRVWRALRAVEVGLRELEHRVEEAWPGRVVRPEELAAQVASLWRELERVWIALGRTTPADEHAETRARVDGLTGRVETIEAALRTTTDPGDFRSVDERIGRLERTVAIHAEDISKLKDAHG